MRGRLFRKYAAFFIVLVGVALVANSGIEFWFSYQETKAALIGMALGLPGAYLVGKTLKSLLYNVGAFDVRALIGVAIVLLASALVACYVPARRATKIDPLAALRQE